MKKRFISFISIIMILIIGNVFADEPIKLLINGKYISSDANPVIENDRTLVPIRVISENLGIPVSWDNESKQITLKKNNLNYVFEIGKNEYKKEDEILPLDASPKIINNRTFVPIRVVAEIFENKVNWDGKTKTVIIGEEKNQTANDIALDLKSKGIPIDKIIVYNKDNDVNKLLGKPGQYTSKVNFSIKGLEQFNPDDPNGGSIEVFKNNADAVKRKNFIIDTIKNDKVLSTYYKSEFLYIKDNVLLRLHPDNFGNEEKYKEIFMK